MCRFVSQLKPKPKQPGSEPPLVHSEPLRKIIRIDAQPGASASSFTRIMVNGHAQSSTVDSNARPTSTDSAAGALATAAFAGKMVKKVSAAKKRWLLKNALSKQMMGFAKNFWRYDTDRSGEIDRCVLITC